MGNHKKRIIKFINVFFSLFLKQHKIHCIGDSHAEIFHFISDNYIWKRTKYDFCIVHGATALGLANPRSTTNAFHIFSKYLENIGREDVALFCLGEVDCGFVIWYQAAKKGISVREQFNESLENYQKLVIRTAKIARNILILSTPLPTISDNQVWGEVAHARSEVRASLRERTDLTLRYNEALRDFSAKNDFTFIDMQKFTLNPKSNLIDSYFLNADPLNHHLSVEKTAPYIYQELKKIHFI